MAATVKGFMWFVCANKIAFYRLFELTNRVWFSVVCTLIDNDIRYHSGQNVVDSRGAVFISERDQNHDSKKEQALSITVS